MSATVVVVHEFSHRVNVMIDEETTGVETTVTWMTAHLQLITVGMRCLASITMSEDLHQRIQAVEIVVMSQLQAHQPVLAECVTSLLQPPVPQGKCSNLQDLVDLRKIPTTAD